MTPKIIPASIDRDEEETELPSDEDIDEEMDSEETSDEDVPEVENAEPADTETLESLEEPEPVAAKEKPAECGGASVHWKTCGTKSECQYVKKADVESCGVSAWGCYLASDLTC